MLEKSLNRVTFQSPEETQIERRFKKKCIGDIVTIVEEKVHDILIKRKIDEQKEDLHSQQRDGTSKLVLNHEMLKS